MKVFLIHIPLILLFACKSGKEIDTRWARDRNVGTKLLGKTVVYTIFVDTKTTLPFSGFDMASTKDSLNKVFDWVTAEAKKHDQNLEIIPVYFKSATKVTINKNLPYDKLSNAFSDGDYSAVVRLKRYI